MNQLLCVLMTVSAMASATGVWTKPGTGGAQVRLWPVEFMKSGAFAINGAFKSTHLQLKSNRPVKCNESVERYAWVGHKVLAGEVFTAEAGKRLGSDLSAAYQNGCWNGVQIDVEPLAQPPAEWLSFLGGVREGLAAKLKLHVAIPIVTTKEITGVRWTAAQALETLGAADGVAMMIYDTGLKARAEYEAVVEEAAAFASTAAKQFPEKRIFLGLPAYEDKTALHQKGVETLSAALEALKRKNICDANVGVALYAEWTLDKKEISDADAYASWHKESCAKGNP